MSCEEKTLPRKACPFLGCRWDPSIRYMVPDSGNRCFARNRTVRKLWFFKKLAPGCKLELGTQRSLCYGNFQSCADYLKKQKYQKQASSCPSRGTFSIPPHTSFAENADARLSTLPLASGSGSDSTVR